MSIQFQDYYQTLGVSREASQEEIQKAYRKLARKYHPDVNKEKGAEDQFKKVSEAYEVLKTPESRKKYDALGQNWKAGDSFTPPSGWQNVEFNFRNAQGGGGGFSDFFDMIFGQPFGGSPMGSDGEDQEAELEISLEEAFLGTEKEIILEVSSGGRRRTKHLKVKIPAGATEGMRMRLKGQGEKGRGNGKAGDLLLKIKLKSHPHFQVSGSNLSTAVWISPWEAVLGAKVEVPTLSGPVNVKIPAGSQADKRLRLKGKGLPMKAGEFGDLEVELKIQVPAQPSDKEKELFEALAKASSFTPRQQA